MITKNETRTKVWNYLINTLKMNEYGAAGFMGNLHAESGVSPNCVDNLLIQRYDEDSKNYNVPYIKGYKRPVNTAANISYNSQRYTRFIDTGVISKAEFLHPRSYTGRKHQYGYGIWQISSEGRKARLWANTVAKGKSIADTDGQLQTLRQELTGPYKSVLKVCQTAKSVDEASDYVLIHFEAPANAESMKSTRRGYGKEYYTLYHVNAVKQEEKILFKGKVTTNLYTHTTASLKSPHLKSYPILKKGTTINVISEKTETYYFEYKGKHGFCSKKYVERI